jgi:phage terminase large subunit-like protein
MGSTVKKHDPKKLKEVLETLEAMEHQRRFRKLDLYVPYPKQREFHDMGLLKRERLLMAGNQEGKTYSGAAEAAFHLTGEYPADWKGRKFDHPVKAWICGESSVLVRDQPQSLLCGTPGVEEDRGTGLIPKGSLKDWSLARGVTDAYDTIQVVHKTNGVEDGISTATFKSYEQGRQKFQSATLDFLWLDEECDEDIYSECIARITATNGMLFMTFTPLKGRSAVVIRYMDEISPDRGIVHMTIEDALHIRAEDREKIIMGYKAHERDARARGIPLLGSGVVFIVPEVSITEPAIHTVPSYWAKLWGIDFGIGHPFGAALILWDKDNDIIHLHHAFKMADALPINHAAGMKPIGAEVPVAWPQDGTAREKSSGTALQLLYKKEGLLMLPEHATWPDGGTSTEAGVEEMREREMNGKFKVAAHLSEYFEERRFYHRKDGQLVKLKDDILSAVRVAIMMKRFAKPVMLGGKRAERLRGQIAKGIDFDLF